MWTMSVPIATCTVNGIPWRRAATSRLASSPGPPCSITTSPSAAPRPIDASTARRQALANSSDVSRANPNVPAMSRGPTSSLVLPAIASSRSWIAAEPFKARPLRTLRSTQSFK